MTMREIPRPSWRASENVPSAFRDGALGGGATTPVTDSAGSGSGVFVVAALLDAGTTGAAVATTGAETSTGAGAGAAGGGGSVTGAGSGGSASSSTGAGGGVAGSTQRVSSEMTTSVAATAARVTIATGVDAAAIVWDTGWAGRSVSMTTRYGL